MVTTHNGRTHTQIGNTSWHPPPNEQVTTCGTSRLKLVLDPFALSCHTERFEACHFCLRKGKWVSQPQFWFEIGYLLQLPSPLVLFVLQLNPSPWNIGVFISKFGIQVYNRVIWSFLMANVVQYRNQSDIIWTLRTPTSSQIPLRLMARGPPESPLQGSATSPALL